MKKCPYCAEEIQDEAIVCRYCGKDLVKKKFTFWGNVGTILLYLFLGQIVGWFAGIFIASLFGTDAGTISGAFVNISVVFAGWNVAREKGNNGVMGWLMGFLVLYMIGFLISLPFLLSSSPFTATNSPPPTTTRPPSTPTSDRPATIQAMERIDFFEAITQTAEAKQGYCYHWSEVSANMISKNICVYGTVARIDEIYGAWQIRFGDRSKFFLAAGSFYYPDVGKGSCVYAIGPVLSSAEHVPYINIDNGNLYICEPWME